MKACLRKSLLLSELSYSLALFGTLAFLTFFPISNDVYGDTFDASVIDDSGYGSGDDPIEAAVNSDTNKTLATNYDLNPVSNMSDFSSNNISIPNATRSWQFSLQVQNSTAVGNTKIETKSGITSLNLVGEGYFITSDDSTRDLSALTISAWVKPDYRQGSSVFTIISRENQFALSINNIVPPIRTASFSIFDGMKWQTVTSDTRIGENWTNIAATFNGTTIEVYVNGTLQSTLRITGTPTISANGELTTKTVHNLSSNADIVIGAYLNSLRGKTSNQFSGSISDVSLYDSVFDKSQIAYLYYHHQVSGNVSHAINHLQVQADSIFNHAIVISDDVTTMKTPLDYDNNPVSSDQISIMDTVATDPIIGANYTLPAYYVPLESELNSTIYDNSTIPDNVIPLNNVINDTSLLNDTQLNFTTDSQ